MIIIDKFSIICRDLGWIGIIRLKIKLYLTTESTTLAIDDLSPELVASLDISAIGCLIACGWN